MELDELMRSIESSISFPKRLIEPSYVCRDRGFYLFKAKLKEQKKEVLIKLPEYSFYPYLLAQDHLMLFKKKVKIAYQNTAYKKYLKDIDKIRVILDNAHKIGEKDHKYLVVLPYFFYVLKSSNEEYFSFLNEFQLFKMNKAVSFKKYSNDPKRLVNIFNQLNEEAINNKIIQRAVEDSLTVCNHRFKIIIIPSIKKKSTPLQFLAKQLSVIHQHKRYLIDSEYRQIESYTVVTEAALSICKKAPQSPVSQALSMPENVEKISDFFKKNTCLYLPPFNISDLKSDSQQNSHQLTEQLENKSQFPYSEGSNGSEVLKYDTSQSFLFFNQEFKFLGNDVRCPLTPITNNFGDDTGLDEKRGPKKKFRLS